MQPTSLRAHDRSLTLVTESNTAIGYLQHFRLDRELAEGGMGKVYLAWDTSLERQVAIKMIRAEFAQQASFVDRFLREARAQAQITHSNVVQVFFVGQHADTLFMAMELVDGGSLHDGLEKGARLEWTTALTHLRGLCEGLREAARLNIIHRDIKPANILLDRFGLAHLADFGLAAPVFTREERPPNTPVPTTSLPRLTQVGMVMGSPPYMSPEQAHGEVLDVRTDIYALGATFYELLTGAAPTKAQTQLELERFFAGPAPQTLARRLPQLPARFTAIIDRCMARTKEDRFPDYDALLEAIDAAKPKPIIPASTLPRALSWGIDTAVFVGAVLATPALAVTPTVRAVVCFAALAAWLLLGAALAHAPPGLWLMRLTLKRPPQLEVGAVRAFLRGLLQHAWLLFAGLALAAVYEAQSTTLGVAWLILAALFFLAAVGGAFVRFFQSQRRTLMDLLTGTQVLVDVR